MMADVVADLASHRCSDMEIAAFLIACASFMTADETLALTEAMVAAGARLSLGRAHGGRQALHRRHPGQPHLADRRADRRRARPA